MCLNYIRRERTAWFVHFSLALAILLCVSRANAIERFAALSMLESGDDDFALGKYLEISRYQIRPGVWQQVTSVPVCQATNSVVALGVAQAVAAKCCQDFERLHGRPPTDFEFYVMWNAPAQIDNPSRAVRERAKRFVNLIQKKD